MGEPQVTERVVNTILAREGAPQQAASFAGACAFAILPYVVARAWEKMRGLLREK